MFTFLLLLLLPLLLLLLPLLLPPILLRIQTSSSLAKAFLEHRLMLMLVIYFETSISYA